MSAHQLLPLFALALNVLLLGSALAGDRRSRRHRIFGALVGALAVWNLGVFGLRLSGSHAVAMVWEQFLHVGVIPIPVLFYHYVRAFLDERRPDRILAVGYALCLVFILSVPTPLFMRGVLDSYWGYMPLAGPLYTPFFLYFQVFIVAGLARLLRAYSALPSNVSRKRANLVIIGVTVSLLGGVVDLVRFVLGWEWLYPIGIPCNMVFALALGLGIIRYRLLSLSFVARRGVLYVLTAAALGPALVGTLYAARLIAPRFLGAHPAINVVIAILAIAVALPLLRGLERSLERLMFARHHGVRDALMALSRRLSTILDLDVLAPTLTEGLVARIPAIHASLHLRRADDEPFTAVAHSTSREAEAPAPDVGDLRPLAPWLGTDPAPVEELARRGDAGPALRAAVAALERAQVALVVPLFAERRLTGLLLIGEKVSGHVFHPFEIDLLEMLAGQTAIALENSRLYSDLRAQMRELQHAQHQIVQSAKLAAVGSVAASVAHEINNPLTIILGNCQLAGMELPEGSRTHKRMVAIESEARRAGRITRNLLNLARRREPNRERMMLNGLVDGVLELLAVKMSHAHVQPEVALDPALPPILGDADQLTQVLLNLAGNAIDAMPEGGTLRIETAHCAEPNSVVLRVTDTGTGMTPELMARIFEPFFTTKPEGRGTGLGMSVCQGIVKSHGGTIEVQSEPGRGTTMLVRLPVHSVEPALAAAHA